MKSILIVIKRKQTCETVIYWEIGQVYFRNKFGDLEFHWGGGHLVLILSFKIPEQYYLKAIKDS